MQRIFNGVHIFMKLLCCYLEHLDSLRLGRAKRWWAGLGYSVKPNLITAKVIPFRACATSQVIMLFPRAPRMAVTSVVAVLWISFRGEENDGLWAQYWVSRKSRSRKVRSLENTMAWGGGRWELKFGSSPRTAALRGTFDTDHCRGARSRLFLHFTGLFPAKDISQAIQIFDIKAKFTIRPRVVHQPPKFRLYYFRLY